MRMLVKRINFRMRNCWRNWRESSISFTDCIDYKLRRCIRTLTSAAVDTTSSALARILHLLAENQDVQEKLRREIVDAHKDGNELSYDELVELPYLEAVCRETLRL